MARWVLLKHTLPDGSWHLDWMLERPGRAGLATFRLPGPGLAGMPAALHAWESWRSAGVPLDVEGEAIGDHRAAYLDYEGPVSGGRGGVARLATGTLTWVRDDAGSLEVVLDWGAGRARVIGARTGPGVWMFRVEPLAASG